MDHLRRQAHRRPHPTQPPDQAYAQLWLADKRFQWAGLAAFASKQVGCGLLHAAGNIDKAQEEMQANHQRTDILNSSDGAAIDVMPGSISGSSAYMFQQLALGNTTLFLDIYPLHRFYMLRGYQHFERCLAERPTIVDRILWPRTLTEASINEIASFGGKK